MHTVAVVLIKLFASGFSLNSNSSPWSLLAQTAEKTEFIVARELRGSQSIVWALSPWSLGVKVKNLGKDLNRNAVLKGVEVFPDMLWVGRTGLIAQGIRSVQLLPHSFLCCFRYAQCG